MIAIITVSAVILLVVFLLASSIKIEFEYDSDIFIKVKYLIFTTFMMPKSKRMIKKEQRKAKKEAKKQERLLKKRERLRKKRLKGQHLNSKKAKSSSNTQSQALNKSKQSSSVTQKPSANGTSSHASPKASSAQGSEQTAPRGKTNSADSEKRSDKGNNVSFSDMINASKNKEGKIKPDVKLIVNCVRAAKPYVKRIFKKVRFDDVFVEIVVGGDDAAKTAISYGVHCAAVDGLVCFLKNTVSFKHKKIDIKADFDLEKTDYYVYCKIKLRLSTFLYCLLWGHFAMNGEIEKHKADNKKAQATKRTEKPKKAA